MKFGVCIAEDVASLTLEKQSHTSLGNQPMAGQLGVSLTNRMFDWTKYK